MDCLCKLDNVHAFLSYARLDKCEVLLLENILLGIGIPRRNIFRDEASIRAGSDWKKEIVKSIEETTLFLCLWTNNSIKSEMVANERVYAYAMNNIDSTENSKYKDGELRKEEKGTSTNIIDIVCEEIKDSESQLREYSAYQQIRFNRREDFIRYGEKVVKLDMLQVLCEIKPKIKCSTNKDLDQVGENVDTDETKGQIQELRKLGDRYTKQYQFEKARFLYEVAQEKGKGSVLNSCEETELMLKIGETYYLQGNYSDAFDLYKKLLAQFKEDKRGSECDSYALTLRIKNNLAKVYRALGHYKKALDLYSEVVKSSKSKKELVNITLTSINGWIRLLRAQGKYKEALQIYREKVKDVDNREVEMELKLILKNNLGLLYWNLGCFNKARKIHLELELDMKDAFGEGHPETLANMRNLALAYSSLKDYEIALDKLEEAKSRSERVLGIGHPETLKCTNNLADIYRRLGRTDKALDLLKTIMSESEKLGKDHQTTLTIMYTLAMVYEDMCEFEKAEQLYKDVKCRAERDFKQEHRLVQGSREGMKRIHKRKDSE